MTASTSNCILLSSALIIILSSLFVTETSAINTLKPNTKNLFDIGCATLCQDFVGVDPIDVNGDEFADLVTEYLEQEGAGGGGDSKGSGGNGGSGSPTHLFSEAPLHHW